MSRIYRLVYGDRHAEDADRQTASLAALAVVLLILVAIVAYVATRPGPPPPPKPTKEAYDYLAKLNITDIHLSAEGNLLGHDVVMVDAKMTNTGDRVVTMLRLRLYFYDYQGKLVLREEQDVITPNMLPLYAGETRDFQLHSAVSAIEVFQHRALSTNDFVLHDVTIDRPHFALMPVRLHDPRGILLDLLGHHLLQLFHWYRRDVASVQAEVQLFAIDRQAQRRDLVPQLLFLALAQSHDLQLLVDLIELPPQRFDFLLLIIQRRADARLLLLALLK